MCAPFNEHPSHRPEHEPGSRDDNLAEQTLYEWNFGHESYSRNHPLLCLQGNALLDGRRRVPRGRFGDTTVQRAWPDCHGGLVHAYHHDGVASRRPTGDEPVPLESGGALFRFQPG